MHTQHDKKYQSAVKNIIFAKKLSIVVIIFVIRHCIFVSSLIDITVKGLHVKVKNSRHGSSRKTT